MSSVGSSKTLMRQTSFESLDQLSAELYEFTLSETETETTAALVKKQVEDAKSQKLVCELLLLDMEKILESKSTGKLTDTSDTLASLQFMKEEIEIMLQTLRLSYVLAESSGVPQSLQEVFEMEERLEAANHEWALRLHSCIFFDILINTEK